MRKTLRFLALSLLVTALLLIMSLQLLHYARFGHVVGYGIHVDVLEREADIGIKGVTTMYSARLFNYTLLPLKVEGIVATGGYAASGTWYRFAVQRWNTSAEEWETVSDANPWELGEKLKRTTVWPAGSFCPIPWSAIAGMDTFSKNDKARFAIFLSAASDAPSQKVVYSPAILIHEEPTRRGRTTNR